ncbi:MAG: AarF/UbiB family protein [Acidobacteriota bacterium]
MSSTSPQPSPPMDTRRYRRIRGFILRTLVHALWWEVILRLPLLRALRSDPLPRWQRRAREFRTLAVDLGGVLIKLGQYLSTRVDVLPEAIVDELSGLRDEVPPEDFDKVLERIEEAYGRPPGEIFAAIERHPLGAASLAQVHSVRLRPELLQQDGAPSEEAPSETAPSETTQPSAAVIKVLRPRIEILVETDLAAVSLAVRWLKRWKAIARRADLEAMAEEFAATTRRELDLRLEASNTEHFRDAFADDPRVEVPEILSGFTTRSTLIESNVAFLPAQREPLLAAGIDPAEVAQTLFQLYLEQLFRHDLIHADPHPGNLFLRPLPTAQERAAGRQAFQPGEEVPKVDQREFRVVFIDFGMMTTIPPHLRDSLRRYALGLIQRDPAQVVRALSDAGLLLPGADLESLEEAVAVILDRIWGVDIGKLNTAALDAAPSLMKEFGSLLLETPVQAPVDLLFTGRAMELLLGLTTSLDPRFDPWRAARPYAKILGDGGLVEGLSRRSRQLARFPLEVIDLVSDARAGRLTVRTRPDAASRRRQQRLEARLESLRWLVAGSALLVSGALMRSLGSGGEALFGTLALGLGTLLLIVGLLR